MTAKLIKLFPDGDPEKGMEPCQYASPEKIIGEMPTETGFNFFSNSAGNLNAGVWEATPCKEHTGPGGYGVDEFMYVISGSVTMTGDDGESLTVKAGGHDRHRRTRPVGQLVQSGPRYRHGQPVGRG